jgi:hypothetical protein
MVVLAVVFFAAGGSATAQATWNLTGAWRGSAGTLMQLRQSGTTVTWFARAADTKAWAHDFTGAISGNSISGAFQDRAGYQVHNRGLITARIIDNCHFVITGVGVNGASPTGGGERFTKTPCRALAQQPWPALPDALVPIGSVSNGCGGGEASAQGKFGDISTYRDSNINPTARSYAVNFREACKLHDAGYSGAKVRDALHGGAVVDFFTWTKERVDKKFLDDMILICERTIPASAVTALANCKATGGNFSAGARSRFNFVDRFGSLFWKDRPNIRGLWTVKGDAAAPPWAVTQKIRTVKAAWRGGAGHPNLRGEFRGTLISRDQDTVIRGFAQITENEETKIGAMSLLFDPGTVLADKIVVLGPGMTATLKR